MKNFDNQLEQGKNLLNNKPNDFEANFNVGNLYYENGEESFTKAKLIDSDEEGKSLISNGTKMMQNSMPYLEKAFDTDPKNKTVVRKLASVYSYLNLDHKIKGINERIDK